MLEHGKCRCYVGHRCWPNCTCANCCNKQCGICEDCKQDQLSLQPSLIQEAKHV